MPLGEALLGRALTLEDYAWGAAFVTDLVNTVAGLRAGDTLTSAGELEALLARHDGTDAAGGLADADVRAVRAVRARLYAVIEERDDHRAVAALDALLEGPRHAVGLAERPGGSGWSWSVTVPPAAPLAERLQAIGAVSLLGVVKALGTDRFRACSAPDCSGVFVDTTRAGRRKYCQPAVCGNRQNVAAYRARLSQAP
ncbi:MAG TPA: CGNR zinc finger domain-containing protein [Solirubrobacteraceae bacterium]|nr:CGNR zinc finger domain-containing protein [Solirubrobacteraceae bacterium]